MAIRKISAAEAAEFVHDPKTTITMLKQFSKLNGMKANGSTKSALIDSIQSILDALPGMEFQVDAMQEATQVSTNAISKKNGSIGLVVVAIALMVILSSAVYFVATVANNLFGGSRDNTATAVDNIARDRSNRETPPTDLARPWYPKDATSWTKWTKVSKQNRDVLASMMEEHGAMYNKSISYMLQEETKGKTFSKVLRKGTRVREAFYGDNTNNGKYKWGWYILKEDTTFLTFPDGTIAFDTTCGNTAIYEKQPAQTVTHQRSTTRQTTVTHHHRQSRYVPPKPPQKSCSGTDKGVVRDSSGNVVAVTPESKVYQE